MAIKIINPKMKVNTFKLERVLTSQDIYKRMGVRCKSASSSDEVANFSRNPVELSDIDLANYDRMRRDEWNKQQEEIRQKQKENSEESTE